MEEQPHTDSVVLSVSGTAVDISSLIRVRVLFVFSNVY